MEWGAPGVDPGKLRSYHTAVTISDGFCGSATLDLNTGSVLSLVVADASIEFAAALQQLANHKLNPRKPALLTVLCAPDQSAMVPELLASDKEGQAHLTLLHGQTLTGALRNRHLEESGARFYFRNDGAMERQVLGTWPSAMLYPMQLAITRSALSRVEAKKRTLLVHVLGDRTDLAIVDSSGPILCNSFLTKTPEDLLYFALFAAEQTASDKDDLVCYYAGPACTQQHVDLLEEYLPQVCPANNSKELADKKNAFRWLSLIERDICVS